MSRVVLVNLDEGQVVAKCLNEKVGVSAIERLPSGGVRLVCNSSEGAGTMMRKLNGHLIKGPVVRQQHRPANPLW